MSQLPKATPAAEYLKSYIQDVLTAFQTGAGVQNGLPLPMTFDLALKSIWYEIDKIFYQEWPKDADRRVTLRLQSKHNLIHLLKILTPYGTWTVRSTGGGGEGAQTVVHITGLLQAPNMLISLLAALANDGWTATTVTLGTT